MIKKLFRQMSTTQIISAMTTTICLLIDSIVIGRLISVDAMSAYGIANPLMIVFTALGTMMVSGVQVTLGKTMGRGDLEGMSACYSTSVLMSLGLGAFGVLLVWLAGNPICTMLGAGNPGPDNPVFSMTGDYLRGFMLGAPFFFLNQIMSAYLQAMGKRKMLLVSVLAMIVTDVAADLMSVFVFRAGMFGIGLASGLSYAASFAVGLGYFLKKDCLFRFSRKGVQVQYAAAIVRAGSPVLLNQVFYTVRVFAYNHILLGIGGNTAVAVFAVFCTINSLLFSIGLGAGSVTLLLSSIFYSEEDRPSLQALVRVMINYTLVVITAAALLTALASPWLNRLFLGDNPAALAIAVPGLRLFVISLIPAVINTIFKNYFQGIQHTGITTLISFLESVCLTVFCAWLFSRSFGLTGFWCGLILGQLLTRLAISIIIWHKNKGIAFTDVVFCYLDTDFGAKPDECMELSIPDIDTAVNASEQFIVFCREKGIAERTSALIGLCVEEMTVNIIEHGFTKDKHLNSIDVRLVVKPDKRIIRIRDNCVSFDPTHYLDLHHSDDPAAHIGLRLVMGMVKDINYANILGLNNLTMIL